MNFRFNTDVLEKAKLDAIRTVAKTEMGKISEIVHSKPENRKNDTEKDEDMLKDGYDECDTELEKAMYMYQCYPCLRNNINSYLPILKRKVIGQDKALQKLIYVAYFNQYINFLEEYTEDENYKRQAMLLIAPTGCGKSTMLRALEKAFDVPVYRANVTAITSAGYVGDKVESMILGLIKRAKGNIAEAERGILLIDEIDKKIVSTTNDRDVAGKAVQQEILKLFDKGVITVPMGDGSREKKVEFETGKLTIILAGACVGLDEIRNKRLKPKNKIGFYQSETSEKLDEEYISEDLIEYGFIPELVGRIDIIQELEPYTKEKLIDIIYFSDESSMQAHVKILETLGIEKIMIDGALWEKIAEQILESNLGVRELNNIMSKLFYPIIFEAFQHITDGTCTIDADGNYTLTYYGEGGSYTGKCINLEGKN